MIGLTLSIAVPRFDSAPDRVRGQLDSANRKKIEGAAQVYRLDVGVFPACIEDLLQQPDGVKGWRGPYLKEIPQNPFPSAQDYQINALGQVQ